MSPDLYCRNCGEPLSEKVKTLLVVVAMIVGLACGGYSVWSMGPQWICEDEGAGRVCRSEDGREMYVEER